MQRLEPEGEINPYIVEEKYASYSDATDDRDKDSGSYSDDVDSNSPHKDDIDSSGPENEDDIPTSTPQLRVEASVPIGQGAIPKTPGRRTDPNLQNDSSSGSNSSLDDISYQRPVFNLPDDPSSSNYSNPDDFISPHFETLNESEPLQTQLTQVQGEPPDSLRLSIMESSGEISRDDIYHMAYENLPQSMDLDVYDIDAGNPGKVLIINNIKFLGGGLQERFGSQYDSGIFQI